MSNIIWFTGTNASLQSSSSATAATANWWNDTKAVIIEGVSGAVLYGEVDSECITVKIGDKVQAGQKIAAVVTSVLKYNKGRPMVMLHLELMIHGSTEALWWTNMSDRPVQLRDPLPLLKTAAPDAPHFDLSLYDGEQFIDPNAPCKDSVYWHVWRK